MLELDRRQSTFITILTAVPSFEPSHFTGQQPISEPGLSLLKVTHAAPSGLALTGQLAELFGIGQQNRGAVIINFDPAFFDQLLHDFGRFFV